MNINTPPFSSLERHLLPPPISTVLDELVKEQKENGIHTTADETAEAIETWFRLVGALLLAEYLDSGAPKGDLNRWLFSLLSDKRPILSGTWVAIGRACHAELKKIWSKSRIPTWEGLKNIDLGSPGDKEHPVTRLIKYRNHFGHGSFAQVEDEIIEHGHLLEAQIKILFDDLKERPIRMVNTNNSVAIMQGQEPRNYAHTLENSRAPDNLPALTAYVQMPGGSHRILAPAIQLSQQKDGHWSLTHTQLDNTKEPIDPTLLQQFSENLQRYRREQAGHIEFEENQIPKQSGKENLAISGIDNAIASENILTLVHYRPGTGQYQLAANLWKLGNERFTQTFLWRVIKDEHETHPSARGSVFARALLRHAESTLNLKEGALESNGGDLLTAVAQAGRDLEKANKKVACIIMDADLGVTAPASDHLSVIDISKAATGGFRLILLAKPSQSIKLPHDGPSLMAELPSEENFDETELNTALNEWLAEHKQIRISTIKQIIAKGNLWQEQEEPLLMAVEDVEKAMGIPLFAPAVEHALWTAAPFIETNRNQYQTSYWSVPAGNNDSYKHHLERLLDIHAAQEKRS